MTDAFNRSINYLRVSVTDRCNLRCMYCMPQSGIDKKTHSDILTLEEIFRIVEASHHLGIEKVRLTGGEPLLRKGILSLIERISNLNGIKDLSMTTNGVLLEKNAADLKNAGLNRVNISLDTLDAKKYEYITRGGNLSDVLNGIDSAIECGLTPIKINIVLVGGFNDNEIEALANLAMDKPIHVRFIELMPIGQASSWSSEKFVSNDVVKKRLGLIPDPEDSFGPAQMYSMEGAVGKIGLINPISHAFCGNCNRIRLTADGKIKPCLMTDSEVDLKPALRNCGDLAAEIVRAICEKPERSGLSSDLFVPIERDMYRIGG